MSRIVGSLPERSVGAHATDRRACYAWLLFLLAGLPGCTPGTHQPDAHQGDLRAPMAAASGAIIQYEIEGLHAERFMAHQHELRAQ